MNLSWFYQLKVYGELYRVQVQWNLSNQNDLDATLFEYELNILERYVKNIMQNKIDALLIN